VSHRVSAACPPIYPVTGISIGEPIRAGQLGAIADIEAHLLGAQFTQVCNIAYGPSELDNGTLRVRHRSSVNARSICAIMVPLGETDLSSSDGTVELVGAAAAATKHVRFPETTADDLENTLVWTKALTSDTLQEHVFNLVNVRPHSLSIYESPLGLLTGSDQHLDASFGYTNLLMTDDDTRGFGAAVNNVLFARRNMRRHLVNIAWPYGASSGGYVTTAGTRTYMIGSATTNDGIRVRTRSGLGTDLGEIPARLQIYAADVGSSVFQCFVTVEGGSSYNFSGINAAGWWPSANGGLSIGIDEGGQEIKVEFQRTSGSGVLRVASCVVYEDHTIPT